MRKLRNLTLGVLALLVLALGGVLLVLWLSLPRYDGRVVAQGLEAPLRIVRDRHAIPHIEAASLRDAVFGLGYAHAQDRLFQMEIHRRAGSGRMAEILGEATLPLDRLVRTLGFRRQAEASLAYLAPRSQALLEAYAAGVNAFLATRRGLLPPEFLLLRHAPEPWTAADSAVWARMMALELSGNWREELLRARLARRLGPEQIEDIWPPEPADAPVTLDAALEGLDLDRLAAALPPAPPPVMGSNAWVLAGSRTADGAPILANDPHLGLRAPGIWYLAHLRVPGLDVIGATMPGLPLVVLGRNQHIAWGMTTTHSDTQDLFIERIDPEDPGRYLAPDGPRPFEERTEVIGIRGGGEERLRVRTTRHGPVVSGLLAAGLRPDDDHVLALAWPALREDDLTLQAGFGIMAADGWEAFREALRDYVAPQQNIHYADAQGRIGFIAAGQVPVRRAGDGRLPVPGHDGSHDWVGLIPFEALPQAVDPPGGALFNANNRIVDDDYPHLLTADWPPPLRARRLAALIDGPGHDLEASRAMQQDEVSLLARDFLPLLLAAEPASPRAREAMALLAAWDGRMAAELAEPLIFTAWYRALRRRVYADELGPLFDELWGQRAAFMRRALTTRQAWCNDITTDVMETCAQQIALALEDALAQLARLHGDDMAGWRWGEAHRVVMPHEVLRSLPLVGRLADLGFASGGDGSTLNATHVSPRDRERPFTSSIGPSYREVVDLGDPERSRFIAATGQSGHPLSRHYRDLTRLWAAGGDVAMTTRPERYGESARGVLELVPPGG